MDKYHNDLEYGMCCALVIASKSRCISQKVGCVIMRDGRIVSSGYNGTAPGVPNCDSVNCVDEPNHSEWSRKNEIHAEMNAILAAAKNGISLQGCTLITTLSPCPECCKNISMSGVNKIVYLKRYDKSEPNWIDKCESYGISVEHISKECIVEVYKSMGNILRK